MDPAQGAGIGSGESSLENEREASSLNVRDVFGRVDPVIVVGLGSGESLLEDEREAFGQSTGCLPVGRSGVRSRVSLWENLCSRGSGKVSGLATGRLRVSVLRVRGWVRSGRFSP